MVSLNRVQKLLKTLIGQAIAEAIMLKYILQLDKALEVSEQHAIRQLLASPVMHVDETFMRLDEKNHWEHVCSAGDTFKRLHAKRGSVVTDEIFSWAAPSYPAIGGTIIQDCWASYFSYHQSENGLCGLHCSVN